MTISIKPTASGSTIEQDGSTVLSIESDRSVDIDSGTLHVDATNNNVGIGTTSPTNFGSNFKMLAVQGSDFGVIQAISNSGSTTVEMMGANGTGFVGTRTNHPLVLRTNDTERMRINSNGVVTKPYQPAFATKGTTGSVVVAAGASVPFNSKMYDNGNNFNSSTYTFTAPVAGTYYFNASIYIQGTIAVCFFKNGAQYGSPTPLAKSASTDQYDTSRSLSLILNLAANDTVSVNSRGTQTSTIYTPHSSFSGFLIG